MFFADPVTAVRETMRVILNGGYVSFAVSGPKEANPFFSTVSDVIDHLWSLRHRTRTRQIHSVSPFPVSWLESWKELTLKM